MQLFLKDDDGRRPGVQGVDPLDLKGPDPVNDLGRSQTAVGLPNIFES